VSNKYKAAIRYLRHISNHLSPGTDKESCDAAIKLLEVRDVVHPDGLTNGEEREK